MDKQGKSSLYDVSAEYTLFVDKYLRPPLLRHHVLYVHVIGHFSGQVANDVAIGPARQEDLMPAGRKLTLALAKPDSNSSLGS